jgi:hypothetical protein
MIEVVVNFNIIKNNALLLLINIYFSNPHCRFSGLEIAPSATGKRVS